MQPYFTYTRTERNAIIPVRPPPAPSHLELYNLDISSTREVSHTDFTTINVIPPASPVHNLEWSSLVGFSPPPVARRFSWSKNKNYSVLTHYGTRTRTTVVLLLYFQRSRLKKTRIKIKTLMASFRTNENVQNNNKKKVSRKNCARFGHYYRDSTICKTTMKL